MALRALCVGIALAAASCTTTYTQDQLNEPASVSSPPCKPGDTGPGCAWQNPNCQDPDDDECLGSM